MIRKKKFPIGISDFRELIDKDYFYVDKTEFIEEIIEASAKVLLIPRPRRFGKTLNLSMLRYFFEKNEENLSDLFKGTLIHKKEVFGLHQGKYPVIFMSFKDLKDMSWESMFQGLINLLRDEFLRHGILLESNALSQIEKDFVETVQRGAAGIRDYADSLRYLSEYLHRCHGERVVVLIDEYDTPLHAGYMNGYYEEVVNFMRNFLSGGLKDNKCLFKGVLTGILRVAKESIFLGLNNLDVCTFLKQEFNASFGFTEEEVVHMLEYYGLSDRYDELSHWYNGYLFGGRVIYNPWSVLNYLNSMDKKPRPYWINTASADIINRLATRGGREIREEIGTMLEGESITKPVYDSIVMRDLEKRDDLLWSFLLFSGYLKNTGDAVRKNYYKLKIPNEEVKYIFEDMIVRWFAEKIESNRLEEMTTALETGDIRLFEIMLRQIVTRVMSYHDLGGEPEKVYHALVLGMLLWMSGKYEIRSNRESGYGRYDLMMKPLDPNKQGIVIEFKRVYEDETPEKALDAALKQIESRKYAEELESAGIQKILKIAVVFRGKKLWVREG